MRASRRALLAVVASSALSGCFLHDFTAARAVFADEDAVTPPDLAPIYLAVDETGAPSVYVALTPVGEHLFLEEAYQREEKPKPGEPPWVHLGASETVRFAPLQGKRYVAWYPSSSKSQSVGAAEIDSNGASKWNFKTVPEERRVALAAGRGLVLKDTNLDGALSAATVRGFLSDMIREKPKAIALKPAPRIPLELELRHFAPGPPLAYLPKDELLNPPNRVRPGGRELLAWLEALDKRGNPWGAYALARFHGNGWLVERDLAKSRRFAERAVAQGLTQAKQVLAYLALQEGGADAARKAAALYREAAEAGDGRAMFALARLHEAGNGVEKSEDQALDWLKRAAEAGPPDAQVELARRHLDGKGLPVDEAAAFALMQKAANTGYADALAWVGLLLSQGRGAQKDDGTALHWLRKAAERGQTWAQWQLGEWLLSGRGGKADRDEAMTWLGRAVDAGEKRAEPSLKKARDAQMAEIDAGLKSLRAALDAELRELCGGRLCDKLKDGRRVYRTETFEAWYFEDGRLVPRELWPR